MLLQSNFYAPRFRANPLMRWASPVLSKPMVSAMPDSSLLSFRAIQLMMLQSMLGLLDRFQGVAGVQRFPNFGVPRTGMFGPRLCKRSDGAAVKPLRQGNSISCGQTSVAMAVNCLTGRKLTDADIDRKHGFSLLSALKRESRSAGYTWRDGGNFRASDWKTVEKKLNQEKTPVIMGLNGPVFSASGRGHIVTLLAIQGDTVKYADPADGTVKTVSKRVIESAPGHPHGKFFFYATRVKEPI